MTWSSPKNLQNNDKKHILLESPARKSKYIFQIDIYIR